MRLTQRALCVMTRTGQSKGQNSDKLYNYFCQDYFPCTTLLVMLIIIDNFCIALFSGVPKLTALYNLSLIHISEPTRRA